MPDTLIAPFVRAHRTELPLPENVDMVTGGPPCQGVSGFNLFRDRQVTLTLALTLTTHPHHSPLNLYPNPNLFRDRQDADDKNRQTLVFAEMCELHTTYYLLLTIHYLLPTTAYLPLPTYH